MPELFAFEVMSKRAFPSGLKCSQCFLEITEGRPYVLHSEEQSGIDGVITCVYCVEEGLDEG